jgi:hypothetical protein
VTPVLHAPSLARLPWRRAVAAEGEAAEAGHAEGVPADAEPAPARHLLRTGVIGLVAAVVLAGTLLAVSRAGDPSSVPVAGAQVVDPAAVAPHVPPGRLPHLRETAVMASARVVPDGWRVIPGRRYSLALPDGWLAVDKAAAGATPERAQLEAEHPWDAQVIAALAARVSGEKLALIAVELPWRAGVTTVTIAAIAQPLRVDDVIAAAEAAGVHEVRPVPGRHGLAFRFDTVTGEGVVGEAVARSLIPIGNGWHLVATVSGATTEMTTVQAIADGILTSLWAP